MPVKLAIQEFADFFRSFRRTAFRLETLDRYSVPEEAESYQRFLNGEPPPVSSNEEWCQLIRENVRAGKVMERVHTVSLPLSPYLKFEIDWGYVHSRAAGESIRILDRTKVPQGIASMSDFWLFDDTVLVLMRYDENGGFQGVERENDPKLIGEYVRVRDQLLSASVPLEEFLGRYRAS